MTSQILQLHYYQGNSLWHSSAIDRPALVDLVMLGWLRIQLAKCRMYIINSFNTWLHLVEIWFIPALEDFKESDYPVCYCASLEEL